MMLMRAFLKPGCGTSPIVSTLFDGTNGVD